MQAFSYASAFVFSLVVCVPMSLHQEHFKGHCALFSTGEWRQRDGKFVADWANQAYCNFTIFVAVVTFLLSVGFGARAAAHVKRRTDASFFAAFCEVVAQLAVLALQFIAAVQLSAGFRVWCAEMTRRFETCADAAGNDFVNEEDAIDSDDFFFHLTAALVGVWGAFCSICVAFAFSVVKLLRMHHVETLRYELAKERKSLLTAGKEDNDLDVGTQQEPAVAIVAAARPSSIPPPRPPPPDLSHDDASARRKRPAPSPQQSQTQQQSDVDAESSHSFHSSEMASNTSHEDGSDQQRIEVQVESTPKDASGDSEDEDADVAASATLERRGSSPPAAPPPPPPPPARGNQIRTSNNSSSSEENSSEDVSDSSSDEDDDDQRDFFHSRT